VTGLCGVMAAPACAQAADPPPQPAAAVAASEARPLKIISWNVATSPYATAMRKIKAAAPSWRTSFGAERRTIDAPAAPKAADIDADIVLMQGIINPRAMRRLFPARKWRLLFSPRALESIPKGSVFTAPVSSVEVEGVAIRYRENLRVTGRAEVIGNPEAAATPGIAVRVLEKGRTMWLGSITIPPTCAAAQPCEPLNALAAWRAQHGAAGETIVFGGKIEPGADKLDCRAQRIEIVNRDGSAPQLAEGENRGVFGCLAELSERQP